MATLTHLPLSPRGRRPALIPHHADLRLSLASAEAVLSLATYSPGRDAKDDGVWVLPPSPNNETVGDEFRKDVFTWLNSPTADDDNKPLLVTATTGPTGGGSGALERQNRTMEQPGKRC
ncbi:hypothetical protein K440DRAFT_612496 [Wilcoxina mikolae CBS 423.85]|nr:hypothetical protein K440DRAFT_612496 [Wilcoxina mikolae CBS 423.85]